MTKMRQVTWLLALAGFLLILPSGGAALAQEPAAEEAASLFTGQPPLTGDEVEKYLNTMSAVIASEGDPARMKAAVTEAGWEQLRFAYVNTRINSAMEVIKGGEDAAKALRVGLRPTESELELVKPYETRLEALNEQALELLEQRRPKDGGV